MSEPRRMVVEVIDDATVAMNQALTPEQKVAIASKCHLLARRTIAAQVQHLHPDWNSDQVHREVMRRFLGERTSRLLETLG